MKMSHIFRLFRKLRIRQKILFLIFTTVFTSNVLIFFSSYTLYVNSVKTKAENYSTDMIDQLLKNTDSYFMGLESIALSITFNKLIQDSIVNQYNKTDYDVYKERTYVENALKLFVFSRQNLQISIFTDSQKNTFYSSNSLLPNPGYMYKDDYWYKDAEKAQSSRTIFINNPQNYYNTGDRKPVHTFIYRMIDMYTRDPIGYILMDIDKSQFEDFFKSNYIDIHETIIVNEKNELVYSYPSNKEFDNIAKEIPKNNSWGHFDKNNIAGNQYMVIYGTSEYTKWRIINIIPYKTMLKDISKIKFLLFLIPLTLFAVTVIISYYFSALITNPIKRMQEGMARVKRGQFHFSLPITTMDETGEMIRDFNSMTSQIDMLVKKNETIEVLRKETELKALQQQINPHFLYNTLEMVIGLASENEGDKIISICKNLGSMFRYNLNGKKVVLIEDELNQIISYINILQQRFEGKFQVKYQVNPDILKYKTMKFILQPFVENSISHGFSSIFADGLLLLQIDWSGDKILFQISDNGKGISETVLEEIKYKLRTFGNAALTSTDIPDHLGIMNVFMRLKIMYGGNCTMSIHSSLNNGTVVRIEIPRDI